MAFRPDRKRQLTENFHGIPAGSKLLRSDSIKGEEAEQQQKFVFGIYRSHMGFVEDALKLQHPFDSCVGVPEHLFSSPLESIKKRLTTFVAWKPFN